MRLSLAIALLFAATSSLLAGGPPPPTFLVKEQGWTIYAGTRGCEALNRDLSEFNVAPMNTLWLTRYAGKDPQTVLRVFYWPGAFEPEQAITITIELLGGRKLEYTGMTTEDFIFDSDHGIPPADIKAMADAGYVTVFTPGKANLAFVTRGMGDAASYLEQCTAKFPPQP